MRTYETPGVYFERADASVGGVAPLRTDIAGFVGIAQRGPLGVAVPIESYKQFEAWYGDVVDNGYLAYCARGFFENGGRRVWVVRVASDAASVSGFTMRDTAGPAWRIEASTPGVFGDSLAVRVTEVRRAQTRALVNSIDALRLHARSVAGLARDTLLEVHVGTMTQRVLVADVDAVHRVLVIDRPLAGFAPGARLTVESIAYSMEVFYEGRRIALYEDLSLVARHPRYGPRVLRLPWQTVNVVAPEEPVARSRELADAQQYFRVARNRGATPPPPIVIRELRDRAARDALNLLMDASGADPAPPRLLAGGGDGLAALGVRDFTGERGSPRASDAAWADAHRGLAVLDAVDEVAMLAVPDINIQPRPIPDYAPLPDCVVDHCLPGAPVLVPVPPRRHGDVPPRFGADEIYRVQAAMVEQCELRRDRVALLDPPYDTVAQLTLAASELREWRSRFDSPFATLYAPWLKVVDPLRTQPGRRRGGELTRTIPACGHVAGVYAATDLRTGVHAAPANVPLACVQDASLPIDDERHAMLNTLGINVVRAQPGRGLRMLGARTLSSDTDWRFVNVRRLVSMIERAIDLSIQWAVFEPNDWRTRAKLTLVVGSFLRELWARGAFVGTTPDQAFFVRCDETNNPPDARARGELLMQVGVAPVAPFEFIVLRIGRDVNGFAVREAEPMDAAA